MHLFIPIKSEAQVTWIPKVVLTRY